MISLADAILNIVKEVDLIDPLTQKPYKILKRV